MVRPRKIHEVSAGALTTIKATEAAQDDPHIHPSLYSQSSTHMAQTSYFNARGAKRIVPMKVLVLGFPRTGTACQGVAFPKKNVSKLLREAMDAFIWRLVSLSMLRGFDWDKREDSQGRFAWLCTYMYYLVTMNRNLVSDSDSQQVVYLVGEKQPGNFA
ncbi:hypothetical protein C8J57DRAFT_1240943 [Mycena rebaudengoi]|nr:hypothetical protein C8J57DRAFT_1240943 [Mycena rebaudengoi]